MAVIRLLTDLTPDKFRFRAKTVERNVLFPDSDRQDSTVTAAWIENLWPLAQDQQAAIVAEYGRMLDLPQQVVDQFGTNIIQAFEVVAPNSGSSTVVITPTEVWSYTINGWVNLLTYPIAAQTSVVGLKGETYIHAFGQQLRKFKTPTETITPFSELEDVVLTGVDETLFISMCAAISYLIATDGKSVYWCAPLDPTYWAPDGIGDEFGAGATNILTVRGEIRFVRQNVDGFFVFTDTNIINATYTGDPENPWQFTEVQNSSGTFEHRAVTGDTNLGSVFAWCDNGFAAISNSTANYMFPELTEFLSGSILEEFNTTLNTITSALNAVVDMQVSFIGGRYLCISYGPLQQIRTHIVMFDSLLGLWTRLALEHVCVLEIRESAADQGLIFDNWLDTFDNTPYSFASMGGARATSDVKSVTLSVILADGRITRLSPVDLDTLDTNEADYAELTFEVLPNVLHFADIKVSRNRKTTLSEITLDYTYPAYPDPEDPDSQNVFFSTLDTAIQAYSVEDNTIRDYALAWTGGNQEQYTERVIGSRISVTLKNVSSMQGVEFGLISTGYSR